MGTTTKTSRRTYWFRALAIAFPFLLVGIGNGALYLLDVGVDTTLVVRAAQLPEPVYYLNPNVDRAYCTTDLRGPEPRGFTLPKPPGTMRIVVVGESSVQGYPHASELSFPRQMQVVLKRQLPDTNVEVLNAGIVGVCSLPLVDIVRQSFAAEPDAIVIYAGHNEFYGVGGVASNATLGRLSMNARRFRLTQFLANGLGGEQGGEGELVTRLPKQLSIPTTHAWVMQAERTYESRMNEIADLCASRSVPLVLCSVVSNLRDHSPIAADSPDPTVAKASQAALAEAAAARKNKQPEEAAKRLRAALERDADNAVLHYRLAQSLEEAGDFDEAYDAFVAARDHDPCRYRARSSFREIVERVASAHESKGAIFVDLVPVFADAATPKAPGAEYFVEHVHFTIDGHWLVAQSVSRAIVEKVNRKSWSEERTPTRQELAAEIGLLPEDEVAAHALAHFLYQVPPFDKAVDVNQHRDLLEAKITKLSEPISDQELVLFAGIDNKSKVDDLVDALGRAYLNKGDAQRAYGLFQKGELRRPWLPNSFVFEAVSLQQLGRKDDALKAIEASRKTTLVGMPVIQELREQTERKLKRGR